MGPNRFLREPGQSPTQQTTTKGDISKIGEGDEAIIILCREIISCLVDSKAIGASWNRFPVYVLPDSDFEEYDGITHYDANGAARRIGLRARCPDGRPYKAGAVAGTLLHEMAHALDGYRNNGKKAHSRSFYNHYAGLVSAASRAGIFRLPTGAGAVTHQALCSFDSSSPFSDALDSCVAADRISQPSRSGPPDGRRGPGTAHVTLQHHKCGAREKVAMIDTGSFHSLHREFKKKFPKSCLANEYHGIRTRDDREGFLLDERNLCNVRQGDTIRACKGQQQR